MSVQPDKRLQQIEFAEAHQETWTAHAAAIGLSTSQCSAIKTATSAARASYDAAIAARAASKAATLGYYNNTDDMYALVADAIKTIRLFATSTDDPSVYETAQIPAPQPPTPQPAPGVATDISVAVEPTGALTLKFKANGGGDGGAVYLVKRRLEGESSYTLIGAAATTRGFKTFTDGSLPGGANNIRYIITGQRGALVGDDSPVYTVTIGGSGDGVTASVRMAA